MKRFLRPYRSLGFLVLLGAWAAMAPPGAAAQTQSIFQQLKEHTPLLHSNSQGYLGVDLADVDQQKAQALKLREVRGAVITLIDHDAPAGKIGLKVNDVVLAINNQNVAGADQLRRLLREIPPGRKISLEISRDGNIQTLAVQLVGTCGPPPAGITLTWNQVVGSVLTPPHIIGIATPDSDSFIRPRVEYRNYPEDSGDNRVEGYLDFNSTLRTQRSSASVYGTLEHLDEFNAELPSALYDNLNPSSPTSPETGKSVIGATRDSALVVPKYNFKYSPLWGFGVSGVYQRIDYSPNDDIAHVDFA